MARDDFDKPTREALAQRAGYLCSFPECGSLTIGPSDEDYEGDSDDPFSTLFDVLERNK